MAKPRSATKTAPEREGTVLNVETNLIIARKEVVVDLCESKTDTRKKVARINDTFNKKFTSAAEKEHVNKMAANIAFNLNELDDETLHQVLYHLFFYIKDLGLMQRAKKQEELFSAEETGPAPKAKANGKTNGHDDDEKTPATPIGVAARQIAEQAGATLHED